MKAFITGSQVYGTPNDKSDIDLVVYVTPNELNLLKKFADSDDREKPKKGDSDSGPQFGPELSGSLRFGKLNLLCVTDPLAYAVWLNGTKMLTHEVERSSRCVERDVAITLFESLRRAAGLFSHRPSVEEARDQVETKKKLADTEDRDGEQFWHEGDEVLFPYRGRKQSGIVGKIDYARGIARVRIIFSDADGASFKDLTVDLEYMEKPQQEDRKKPKRWGGG